MTDYFNKYIKYKTKYLNKKEDTYSMLNDDSNELLGGGNKIMFVMFPGWGTSEKGWNTIITENNKKVKHNFIKELRKIGQIYFYNPKYYNLFYYKYNDNLNKSGLYNKDINFTKKDLDVENVCDEIYDNIKNFKGKYVLISHSIGSLFAYTFSQKYSSRCLFWINIDGTPIGPTVFMINYKSDTLPQIIKYTKYTDEDIERLRNKIYKENDKDTIKELLDLAIYNIKNSYNTIAKAKNLKIPTLNFFNFNFDLNEINNWTSYIDKNLINGDDIKGMWPRYWIKSRMEEIEYLQKYNKNYKVITFINKTHYPYHIKDSRETILECIKNMIKNK